MFINLTFEFRLPPHNVTDVSALQQTTEWAILERGQDLMLLLQLKWLCLELQLCLAVIVKYTLGDLMQLWIRLSRSFVLPFEHEQWHRYQSKGQVIWSGIIFE